jgi:hypothetical protein
MTKRASIVTCSLFGALAIHCTSEMTGMNGSDGYVADANAAECCGATAQTFTLLSSGTTSTAARETPAIDVSGYREVVVYIGGSCGGTAYVVGFNAQPNGTFMQTGQTVPGLDYGGAGGRVRVDGPQMKLLHFCTSSTTPLQYMVAGVR